MTLWDLAWILALPFLFILWLESIDDLVQEISKPKYEDYEFPEPPFILIDLNRGTNDRYSA